MKPLFSVITPTYKRLKEIKKLNNHLIKQKRNDLIEWVIVVEKDDIATINYLKKIKLKKKIVLNKGGIQNSFKNGSLQAEGKYVSFLGDDDYYRKNIFKILYNEVKIKNPKWVIGYGSYVNSKGKKIRKKTTLIKNLLLNNFDKTTLLLVDYIMTPSSFCQKKYLKKVGFFENKHWYGNDYVCWIKLSKFVKPKIIKKTLSYATYSENTLSGSFNYKRFVSLYLNISKETKNPIINFFQFLIVIYILIYNLIFKKIL